MAGRGAKGRAFARALDGQCLEFELPTQASLAGISAEKGATIRLIKNNFLQKSLINDYTILIIETAKNRLSWSRKPRVGAAGKADPLPLGRRQGDRGYSVLEGRG